MKKIVGILFSVVALVLVGGAGFLALSSGLKSDPNIGLSSVVHQHESVNVREFTQAPLGAEVKVFLPIPKEEAFKIAYDFEEYPNWVSPPPEKVTVDNSARSDGSYGVGSKISYSPTETDEIQFFKPGLAMIARPLWALDDLDGHRGVVIVTEAENGSIMHMRRYFVTKSFKGWFMSKMMPIFMKSSAENLAEKYEGKVL